MAETFVVIGGDAAGMSAASKAKRENPDLDIVAFEKGEWVSYAACGMPYFVKGEIDTLDDLGQVTPEEFREERDIDLRTGHEVVGIDPEAETVTVDGGAEPFEHPYDSLLVATGASAIEPPFDGMDLDGVFTIHDMDEADAIEAYVTRRYDAKPAPQDRTDRPDYNGRSVLTDQLARTAIEHIGDGLRDAVNNGEDVEARRNMSLGSLMAGAAFTNAGLGATHAIAMAAGAVHHTPHGVTIALTLPEVIRTPLQTMGDAYVGVALFALGAQLAEDDLQVPIGSAGLAVALRLLLAPLLTGLALLLIEMPATVEALLLVGSAAPVGVLLTIFASEFRGNVQLSSAVVVSSTLLSPLIVTAAVVIARLG